MTQYGLVQKERGFAKCHIGEKVYPGHFDYSGPNGVKYGEKSYILIIINPFDDIELMSHEYRSGFKIFQIETNQI